MAQFKKGDNSKDALFHLINVDISDCANVQAIGKSVEDEILDRDARDYSNKSKDPNDIKKIMKAADKLLTEQQRIFLISAFLGMSNVSIAEVNNVTTQQVSKQLAIVKEKLKKHFESHDD